LLKLKLERANEEKKKREMQQLLLKHKCIMKLEKEEYFRGGEGG